jgi:hypothetical protein
MQPPSIAGMLLLVLSCILGIKHFKHTIQDKQFERQRKKIHLKHSTSLCGIAYFCPAPVTS